MTAVGHAQSPLLAIPKVGPDQRLPRRVSRRAVRWLARELELNEPSLPLYRLRSGADPESVSAQPMPIPAEARSESFPAEFAQSSRQCALSNLVLWFVHGTWVGREENDPARHFACLAVPRAAALVVLELGEVGRILLGLEPSAPPPAPALWPKLSGQRLMQAQFEDLLWRRSRGESEAALERLTSIKRQRIEQLIGGRGKSLKVPSGCHPPPTEFLRACGLLGEDEIKGADVFGGMSKALA